MVSLQGKVFICIAGTNTWVPVAIRCAHHKDHFRIIRYKVSLVYCLNFPDVGILHNKSAYTPHHTHTHSEASIQKEAVLSDEDPPYLAAGCAA